MGGVSGVYLIDGWWVMHLYSGPEGLRYQGWMPEGRYTNGFWSLFQWASNGSPGLGWSTVRHCSRRCHGFGLVGAGGVGSGLGLPELPNHSLGVGFCRGGFYCFDYDVSDDGRQLGWAFGALVCFATEKVRDRMTPAWIYRVFQVQLCLFIFSAVYEVASDVWQNGTAALCAGVDGFIVAMDFH